jgi:hypothetical protein
MWYVPIHQWIGPNHMANLLHKFQLDLFALGAELVERKGERFLAIKIDPQMFINESKALVDFAVFECDTEYSSAYIIRSYKKGEAPKDNPICGNIRKNVPKQRVPKNWDE